MVYEKKNFKNGQVLSASHLNHIEEGIYQNSLALSENKSDPNQPVKQHTHQKSDIDGIYEIEDDVKTVTDSLSDLNSRFDRLEQEALTEADKSDIVSDTLTALAGSDTSDAGIAALTSRVGTLETKVKNSSEDIATIQSEIDYLEDCLIDCSTSGWPTVSPNRTMYSIKVNDDGTLYTVPMPEE